MNDCYIGDEQMIRDESRWSGETLCLRRRQKPGEKVGIMGYTAFGVITSGQLPLIVWLRPNFVTQKQYDSYEALFADGWEVD